MTPEELQAIRDRWTTYRHISFWDATAGPLWAATEDLLLLLTEVERLQAQRRGLWQFVKPLEGGH